MRTYKELKAVLKGLNARQYAKRRRLRQIEQHVGLYQARMERNKVVSPEGHPGATYVPLAAVSQLPPLYKKISKMQLELNIGRNRINMIQNQMDAMVDERDSGLDENCQCARCQVAE